MDTAAGTVPIPHHCMVVPIKSEKDESMNDDPMMMVGTVKLWVGTIPSICGWEVMIVISDDDIHYFWWPHCQIWTIARALLFVGLIMLHCACYPLGCDVYVLMTDRINGFGFGFWLRFHRLLICWIWVDWFFGSVVICGGVGKLGAVWVDTLDKFGYWYWETRW